ncbi:hypothetical protein ACLESO_02665 [Pyxidicoccus sp. 3LG]
MRQSFLFVGCLAVLSAGCDRMDDDPIFVYGSAWNRDGSPLAGATLAYESAKEREPPNNGGPPQPHPKLEFQPYGTATTEANGDFFLEMRYGDVQAVDPLEPEWLRQPYRFRLARLEEDGTGTFVSFTFADDVELPAFKPWDARLTVEPGPGGQVVSFMPAPPAPEMPPTAETAYTSNRDQQVVPAPVTTPQAVLLVTSGGKTVYRWWGAESPWTASPYILEDFASPELQLRALSLGDWLFRPLAAASSYLHFRMEWRTAVKALPAANLRPVSRGAACEPMPRGATACPWTDGNPDQTPINRDRYDPTVTVILSEPRRLRHAVIRELSGGTDSLIQLEGSLDGEQWAVLGTTPLLAPVHESHATHYDRFGEKTLLDSPFDPGLPRRFPGHFGEMPLADVGPVRHVRLSLLSFADGDDGRPTLFGSLGELSLFE